MTRWAQRAGIATACLSCACVGAHVNPAAHDTPGAPADNPFIGAKLWVDPDSVAAGLVRAWQKERPEDAAAMARIATQPAALWIGDWIPDVEGWVGRHVRRQARAQTLPVFVAYNIPNRDCGLYSAGGARDGANYGRWIAAIARGLGNHRAVVILEPDALAHMEECLNPPQQAERVRLIKDAVRSLSALGNTYVYLDAGHSNWVPASDMARRLKAAGLEHATGFALNVSNFQTTESLIAYGRRLSALTGGKPFVLDTSRNGRGPPGPGDSTAEPWCNPRGRALGPAPSANTGDPLVHAFLWIKKPGESDGACNGGPKAGVFWADYALELARNAEGS